MGFAFNPFTWRLDNTGAGSTPAGSDTEVQFNDGGSFGGDSYFTYNKASNALAVNLNTTAQGSVHAEGSSSPAAPTGQTASLDATGTAYGATLGTHTYRIYSFTGSVFSETYATATINTSSYRPTSVFFTMGSGSDYNDATTTSFSTIVAALYNSGTEVSKTSSTSQTVTTAPTSYSMYYNQFSGNYYSDGQTWTFRIYGLYNSDANISSTYEEYSFYDESFFDYYYLSHSWSDPSISGLSNIVIYRSNDGFSSSNEYIVVSVGSNYLEDYNDSWTSAGGESWTAGVDYAMTLTYNAASGTSDYRLQVTIEGAT